MRIIVAGATGFLGRALVRALSDRGDEVVVLTRDPASASAQQLTTMKSVRAVAWSGRPSPEPWWRETAAAEAIINLCGDGIVDKRWTAERKQVLRDSRVHPTLAVLQALKDVPPRPRVVLNASAIGYYGARGDEPLTEDSAPGSDFLAGLCLAWEEAAQQGNIPQLRRVRMRIGIVLGHGGALEKMALPFRFLAGGPIGTGRQWVSWIHIDDVVGLFLLALDKPDLDGPFNLTAPNPVTNRDFAHAIGTALHRPSALPAPAFALKWAMGEAAEAALTGQRVIPARALKAGYVFRYPQVEEAVRLALG